MAGWKFYLNNIEVEEPIGWDAVEFTAIRMESHGIDQPFSTELKFYNKGAKLIKSYYDTQFINAEIAISIISDVGYNGAPYQFDGFLNMAIYQEHNVCDTDSWEITVGIIDDNFRENFKARQDVEIDLTSTKDLDGNTIDPLVKKQITMHHQDLYLSANAKNFQARVHAQTSTQDVVVPLYWQQSDFKETYGSTVDTNLVYITPATYGQSCFFQNNGAGLRCLEATGSFDLTIDNNHPSNSVDVKVFFIDINGTTPGTPSYIINTTQNPGTQNYAVTFNNWSLCVNPGIKLTLLVYASYTGNPYTSDVTIDNVQLSLSEINAGEYASTANVLTIEQWLRRSIYLMTGSNNKLLSDAFSESGDGCYWNNALTNGLHIRGADGQDNLGSLKTSWKNVFEDLDKIFCLGWAFEWTGSEWKIRVEPREYFYQNQISQTFTNVGEVDQLAKVDLIKNNITLGFTDKWKNIQLSGVYAIHTDRNYFVGNRAMNEASSAKLDMRSGIIGEGYAIEFSRRLSGITFGGATSDRPNVIWLNRFTLSFDQIENSVFNLPQQTGALTYLPGQVSMPSNYITASNSPLTGLYNIYHTPARIACRWWKVLGMYTYGLANEILRYQVGPSQTSYSSTINGDDENEACIQINNGTIAENSDIYADILNPDFKYYLFKPIGIEFSYPQSLCDFLTLSQDEQYKKVRLTSGSLDIQGFITEATNQPEDASGGTTKFTLLMSAQDALAGGAFDAGFDDGYDT
jgi:hypothetical protein